MSKKSKTSIRFTIPVPMLEGLDSMVEDGTFLNRGEVIMAAFRFFLREKGKAPFAINVSERGIGVKLSKVSKRRLSFLMPNEYLEFMDSLVEKGVFLNRGEVIREAIRIIVREEGIEPFSPEAEEPVK